MNLKTFKKKVDLAKLSTIVSSENSMVKVKQLFSNRLLTMNQFAELLSNWSKFTDKVGDYECSNGHIFKSSANIYYEDRVCPICMSNESNLFGTPKLECSNGFALDGQVWNMTYDKHLCGTTISLKGDFKFSRTQSNDMFGKPFDCWILSNSCVSMTISELDALKITLKTCIRRHALSADLKERIELY